MRKLLIISMALASFFVFQASSMAAEPDNAIQMNVKKIMKAQKSKTPGIEVAEFKALMDKGDSFFEIVDVRTPDEFKSGHIAGAISSDRNKLEWITPKKIKDSKVPIYVYCKAGGRGALATLKLIEMGYENVTNVNGGLKAWANAGYPLYNDLGKFVMAKNGFGKKPE